MIRLGARISPLGTAAELSPRTVRPRGMWPAYEVEAFPREASPLACLPMRSSYRFTLDHKEVDSIEKSTGDDHACFPLTPTVNQKEHV